MDWAPVAALLAESQSKPIVVLDSHGRVELFNTPSEQLLSWNRFDAIGRSWVDTFVPPEGAELARSRLAAALRGALRSYECEVVARDGRRLTLSVSLGLVGGRDDAGLVISVESAIGHGHVDEQRRRRDVDFEMSADLDDFGTVRRIGFMGAAAPELVGQRCFRVLHGREKPCASCPVLSRDTNGWPRTIIRRPAHDRTRFVVVTAEKTEIGTVQMSVRWLAESALGGMLRAKIAEIATAATLSRREQDVLLYLVMGRSLEDVATILGIGVRTVKFHQGNILAKTGADSRVDLIRLLF